MCMCNAKYDRFIAVLVVDPLSDCADCLLPNHYNMHLCYCFDHSIKAPPFKEEDIFTNSFISTH